MSLTNFQLCSVVWDTKHGVEVHHGVVLVSLEKKEKDLQKNLQDSQKDLRKEHVAI